MEYLQFLLNSDQVTLTYYSHRLNVSVWNLDFLQNTCNQEVLWSSFDLEASVS